MDDKNKVTSISLYNWIKTNPSSEEKRSLFLNMDGAMKYVHENGYCIESFNPSEIEILNNSVKFIKFNTLLELPMDKTYRNKLIKEDIFNSSILQVMLYSSLKNINIDFLKSNFELYEQFLPPEDVNYYRTVIQNDAYIYFCEYENERLRREYNELEKQLNEPNNVEHNQINLYKSMENINSKIYRQISPNRRSAFINIVIYPIMITIIILMLLFVSMIISNFIV